MTSQRQAKSNSVTVDQVDQFEVMLPLLKSMYAEFQELSKKKPQDVISSAKVKVINRVLTPVGANKTFLDLLDDDQLPQNSDAVLMLGQAVTAMQSFRLKYYSGTSGWRVAS